MELFANQKKVPANPVRSGLVVDNCQIESLLGAGAFGAVYRAKHITLDHPRALKFLIHQGGIGDGEKRRFLAEARHTARLGHPNIVIVHNVGEYEGLPFIHMEYVHGSSLRALLHKGAPSQDEAVRIIDQVLAALAAAHEQGVVHRDVKPENIMIREGGTVKVVDFGLSVNVEAHTSRLTATPDQILGTPLYMAPEQWQTSFVGPAADVWSAGVVLYESISGQRPFGGRGILQLQENVLKAPLRPLFELVPAVSKPLSRIVDQMLAKSVSERFPDAAQARLALRKILKQSPTPTFSSIATSAPSVIAEPSTIDGLELLTAQGDGARHYRRSADEGEMLWIPGGEFLMGTETGDSDERPSHRVRLSPFLLDEEPISRRQYATFLTMWGSDRDDQGNRMLDPAIAGIQKVGMCWEPEEDDAGPVTGITWYGAVGYARWAGMQLPTEAQIEHVLRRAAEPNDPSPIRLRQLGGETRYWCADTYDENFYRHSPVEDPVNKAPGAFMVIRGCSRLQPCPTGAATRRQFAAPHEMALDVGLRCAYMHSGESP